MKLKPHFFGPFTIWGRQKYRLSPAGYVAVFGAWNKRMLSYAFISEQTSKEICEAYKIAEERWEHLR